MKENFDGAMSASDFNGFSLRHGVKEIIFLDEVGSTNDYAKVLGKAGGPNGSVIVAQKQTAGKGRLGRSWAGGLGQDIYMSLLLRPDISGPEAAQLTLLAGVSTAFTVNEVSEKKAGIKWPNDVVAEGKKICGILTESSFAGNRLEYAVVGIGVNINRLEFPPELQDKATSLALLNGKTYSRQALVKNLLTEFDRRYGNFLENGISSFIDDYRALCINTGKSIMVQEAGKEYRARAIGISPGGSLEIMTESGEMHLLGAGEVSVRGIYGYV